jgi:hypothetical protein
MGQGDPLIPGQLMRLEATGVRNQRVEVDDGDSPAFGFPQSQPGSHRIFTTVWNHRAVLSCR